MSVVTNVILHYQMWYAPDFLEKVNTFFEEGVKGLVSVHDERLPQHWYGGRKYLECELAIGAYNHLDLDGLVRHLCSMIGLQYDPQYEEYKELQLIVLEQEEQRFRIINITDEMAKYPPAMSQDDVPPDAMQ